MQYEKNLLRRFNGSVTAIEAYCRENGIDPTDLNNRYWETRERLARQPKFHKLGKE